MNQDSRLGESRRHGTCIKGLSIRLNDHLQWQRVFHGKFKITLVMGGYSHDCAGAVVHENEVGKVNRHALLCEWIDAV